MRSICLLLMKQQQQQLSTDWPASKPEAQHNCMCGMWCSAEHIKLAIGLTNANICQ
jgi:hypothetical protein